jgi:hypothetical protein
MAGADGIDVHALHLADFFDHVLARHGAALFPCKIMAVHAEDQRALTVDEQNAILDLHALEAEADGFDKEAKRLTAKKQAAENVAKRLKQAMLDAMKMANKTELPTSIGKWKVQSNPLSCEVLDINKVPQEWHIKCDDKIDKAGLINHYKMTGELVDGCEFKQTEGIRFK